MNNLEEVCWLVKSGLRFNIMAVTTEAMKREKHQKNQWSSLKLQGPKRHWPAIWNLERAPRGRWRSTEMIDLFLLEPCCCCCVLTNFHAAMAMGAFLASKPNPSTGYMASTWLPGAANRCVDGTVPAAARGGNYRAPDRLCLCAVRAYGRTCRRSACRRRGRRLRRRQPV